VLFLFFTALWAQIDFLNLMIPSKSSTACQATLVFSTASDQLARGAIEQFLLWSVAQGSKVTAERLILQAILTIRVVAGGLLVGFTRPEFAPVCVARTSLLPISIVVLALDFIIIGVLIIRALSFGMFRALREARSTTHQEQSRALILSLAGFLVWTGVCCRVTNFDIIANALTLGQRGYATRNSNHIYNTSNYITINWSFLARWLVLRSILYKSSLTES